MIYMNIPIEGISISETPEVIHIQGVSPLTTLSSAIVGSGFQRVRHILNAHVDKNYAAPNPKADLRALAHRQNIREPFIGLLTAVHLRKARAAFFELDGLSVGALITAGVSNANCAGVTLSFSVPARNHQYHSHTGCQPDTRRNVECLYHCHRSQVCGTAIQKHPHAR